MTQTATNLNPLFISIVPEYAHLLTTKPQTKAEFIGNIRKTYFKDSKAVIFCAAAERSIFETIQVNSDRDSILFNHLEA